MNMMVVDRTAGDMRVVGMRAVPGTKVDMMVRLFELNYINHLINK